MNRPGRRGDFYTNVSVGTLFGELLALQFAQWLRDCQDRRAECESHGTAARGMQILEAGAHNGQLAAEATLMCKMVDRVLAVQAEKSAK